MVVVLQNLRWLPWFCSALIHEWLMSFQDSWFRWGFFSYHQTLPFVLIILTMIVKFVHLIVIGPLPLSYCEQSCYIKHYNKISLPWEHFCYSNYLINLSFVIFVMSSGNLLLHLWFLDHQRKLERLLHTQILDRNLTCKKQ